MTAVNDFTTAPDAEFQELLDRIEREPEAPEAFGNVEKVARAIYGEDIGSLRPIGWLDANAAVQADYRRLAVVAVVAMDTGQQAAAVRRVLALADELDREADRHDDAEPVSTEGLHRMILAARHCRDHATRIRAAVAGQP